MPIPGPSTRPAPSTLSNIQIPKVPSSSPVPPPSSLPQMTSRGYGSFRPRSTWRENTDSFSPSIGVSAHTTSKLPFELDNWQSLQELADDDGEDLGGSSADMTRRSVPVKRRSLRGFFSTPRLGDVDKMENSPMLVGGIRQQGVVEEEMNGLLSSSPPMMEGMRTEEPSNDPARERGRENGGPPRTPLLEGRRPSPQPRSRSGVRSSTSTTKRYWPPSPATIAILKCSLAYFIASLFTFVPALANLLSTRHETDAHGRTTRRPAYSAHMVATIVVYFNPAKTMGNMILATRFCVILALLAAAVSLLAMGTIEMFDSFSPTRGDEWDWISEMGDWVVCVLWIGGSMAGLAWTKVWVGNPSFNSGCSMAAVTLYTVVIKEGAIPKLLEVLLIVLIGASISNMICFTILPISATTRLQISISRSLTSFSTLLDLLTSTFLLSKPNLKSTHTSLPEAVKAHAAAFKSLQNDLAEAKHERLLDGRIRGKKLDLYDAAIGSLTRLAQHLAGLRGSTRLQEGLIRANKEGKLRFTFGEDGDVDVVSGVEGGLKIGVGERKRMDLGDEVDTAMAVKLVLQFRDIAGDSMDDLVSYCDDALEAVQAITHQLDNSVSEIDIHAVRGSLASSLKTFSSSSSTAIKRLYAGPRREKGIYEDDNQSSDEEGDSAMMEELSDGPNETVFLIYFFLFTLEEFAREMLFLLDTVAEIVDADNMSTVGYLRSLFLPRRGGQTKKSQHLYKQFRQIVPVDPSKLQPPLFPKNQRDARDTLLTPSWRSLRSWAKMRHGVWEVGSFLRRPDIRFAIKTGLGGVILAAPAFTEWGRPTFMEYRGEWALIAYFATMSTTVGQTNYLSFFRTIGTILGAAVAILFYTLFPDNAIILPLLGFLFSIPCFYIITQMPDYIQAGRFILLTYNLTCLYAYNSRERDVDVTEIAFKRSSTVIIGVAWSALVSRYWWPFTARRELRMGISDFCLDLSYLYSKLVTTYSRGIPTAQPSTSRAGELDLLLPAGRHHPHFSPGVRQFMAMELHLQSQLASLRELLAQTRNEPRLKGPFASDFYREVLLSCERMVDRLHSMRCVTTRDEWDNGIRKAFVAPVNKQRREMAGNVILYLYTISAGFRLRTPVPPYLPPAEQARQSLVDAIRNLDVVKRRSVRGGGRHLLFFAYALAMQEVVAELEYLGGLMQEAFGVISQSTVIDFEALFQGDSEVEDVGTGDY